jgi:hypothetical protein
MQSLPREVLNKVFKLKPECTVVIHVTTSNYVYDLVPYVPLLNISMPRFVRDLINLSSML